MCFPKHCADLKFTSESPRRPIIFLDAVNICVNILKSARRTRSFYPFLSAVLLTWNGIYAICKETRAKLLPVSTKPWCNDRRHNLKCLRWGHSISGHVYLINRSPLPVTCALHRCTRRAALLYLISGSGWIFIKGASYDRTIEVLLRNITGERS